MSKKGTITTSEYIPYDDYRRLVQGLIDDKQYKWAAYCIVSFCTGLRFSDVSRIKWGDMLDKQHLVITEQKTGKTRSIPIGQNASKHLHDLWLKLNRPPKNTLILASTKRTDGGPIDIRYVNRYIKEWKYKYNLDIRNFSTHSFRKTFGRYVYDKGGRTAEALVHLNRIFKHNNLDTTMIYLGIRDEEIAGIFNSIEI